MAGKIDAEQVRHVGLLARLRFSEQEIARFSEQLSAILQYVEKLNELDTTGVEPMAHALPITDVFRADEVGESLPPESVLSNAPDSDGRFFLVPRILADESSA